MSFVRRASILFVSSAFALSAAACGGSSSGDDVETVNPAGTAHTYVVNQVILPTKSGEGAKYGLDLDGDNNVDNALGSILSALSSAAGSGSLNLQSSIDDAVQQGKILLLANIKATALDMASGVALQVYIGDINTPVPAACTDPANPTAATCGKYLTAGAGTFTLKGDAPTNNQVVGKIIGSEFNGGPGNLTIQITLSATAGAPITLTLVGAHAKLRGITADALGTAASTGIIAGGVTQSDLDNTVLPAVHDTIAAQITRDCTDLTHPTACGCKSGSTGATVISLFDKNPVNCEVTLDEIKNNDLIKTLLAPDITINGTPALSVGVGVTGVRGTFPVPAANQ
jgi:hypothetical protein